MSDLRELYQEVIMDHNHNPRNHHEMSCATCKARGYNPLCGDQLTVYLHLNAGIIDDISFVGRGCAISQASASLMTDELKGKTVDYAKTLFETFHRLMVEENIEAGESKVLGKLNVLLGVREYPARVKCATLAWHTLDAALKQDDHLISTE